MKNPALKYLTPAIAGACLGLLPNNTHAQTPVFDYNFPASWNGTGTAVTDQSPTGNNGFTVGGLALSSSVPTGATGNSITGGGILTTATSLLNNGAVTSAGGFTYNLEFMWNGGYSTSFSGDQKLIDYAGTESLQLFDTNSATSATLQMVFADDSGAESTAASYTVAANTWYDVTLTFNTEGNAESPTGDISGVADLYVDGVLVSSGDATKGIYGDNLNRQIGIGQLGANFGYLVGFKGDIYDPSVDLGVVAPVPEPSTLALSAMGGIGFVGMMWRGRRRKA